jgi:hypothetical protein
MGFSQARECFVCTHWIWLAAFVVFAGHTVVLIKKNRNKILVVSIYHRRLLSPVCGCLTCGQRTVNYVSKTWYERTCLHSTMLFSDVADLVRRVEDLRWHSFFRLKGVFAEFHFSFKIKQPKSRIAFFLVARLPASLPKVSYS